MGRASSPHCIVDRRLPGNCVTPSSAAACIMRSWELWCTFDQLELSAGRASKDAGAGRLPSSAAWLRVQEGKAAQWQVCTSVTAKSHPYLHLASQTS